MVSFVPLSKCLRFFGITGMLGPGADVDAVAGRRDNGPSGPRRALSVDDAIDVALCEMLILAMVDSAAFFEEVAEVVTACASLKLRICCFTLLDVDAAFAAVLPDAGL